MLKLDRRPGQKIIVTDTTGERITITVLESYNGMCKLGFDACDDIEVNREEIQIKIDESNGSY